MVVDLPQTSSSSEHNTAEANDGGPESVVLPSSSSTGGLPGGDMHFRPESATGASPMLAITAAPSSSSNISDPIDYHRDEPRDENDHKYVGLVNQAMTCYLNSLVQTLYMTPEFRNAIYLWEYKTGGKGAGESSIPCQIQKLFLMLQTTDRDAMETTDLTASFGWTSNEAYDQHDVQELCRLMFDALEHRWKNSPHDKLIQNLYRGTMQDFVKCLTCGKENVRQDFFLDLPLALKPFGVHEAYKSVEEALMAFIAPEKLEGGNQYNCESCNAKRDAHKGLRITDFPYLLTIQLKRFDFDYNTMHRIKLNDKMTFPDILNLNPFIYDPKNPDKEIDFDPKEVLYNGTPTVGYPLNAEEITRLLKQGEYVYELFSVMVHQGSAAGGHYFAYIKNLDQDKWYCFNDARVDNALPVEIEKSYGGIYGGWSNSNTNAYMLMYRKVRDKRNEIFIRSDSLPKHIQTLQNYWKEQEEEKLRQKEYQASLVQVTVILNVPHDRWDLHHCLFERMIPKTTPLKELINMCWPDFDERAKAAGVHLHKNKGRLILLEDRYTMRDAFISKNDFESKLESLFTHNDIIKESKTLGFFYDFLRPGSVKSANRFDVKHNDINQLTIQVARVDIQNRTVSPSYHINLASDKQALIRVKETIGNAFGDDIRESINCRFILQLRDSNSRNFILIDKNFGGATPFKDIISKNDVYMHVPLIYYDGGVPITESLIADRAKSATESEMYKILDRTKFAAVINLRLPNEDDVSRANVFCNNFAGPSWTETVSPSESMMSSPEEQTNTVIEEVEMPSGRSSRGSLTDEAMLGTDSFCNNTPAVSPAVSETDEGFGEERSLSKCRHKEMYVAQLDLHNAGMLWKENVQRLDYSDSTLPDLTRSEQDYSESIPASNTSTSEIAKSLKRMSLASTIVTPADFGHKFVLLSEKDNMLQIDVDRRVTVAEFKEWLSLKLKIDSAQFQICTHHSEDFSDRGYDYNGQDSDSLNNAFGNSSNIDLKLRPPLKQDEKLIKVFLVDLEDLNKDNWKQLFEVPAGKSTLVGDFLLQCLRLYNEIFQANLTYKEIRLRDMTHMTKTLMNPEYTFEQCRQTHQWSNNIFLQIIEDKSLIGKKGESLFIRRFRSSTVEYDKIREIVVDSNSSTNNWELLRQAISENSGIPAENPSISPWDYGRWPYARNRLELLDSSQKFLTEKAESLPDQFIPKIGNRIIYYKDNRETIKELTDDERKQITIKDNSASSTAVQRRKERPLRIQMSSISES